LEELHVKVREEALSSLTAVAGGASKPSQQTTIDPKGKNANPGSKQSRVIALLQSPAGATIAAMMQATAWQQHSVRGFLTGVVRKRLKLKLGSKKVDGTRVYRLQLETTASPARAQTGSQHGLPGTRPLQTPIVLSAPCRALGSVLPCRTANHSTPRLRAWAISASESFAALGTPCSGGSRRLTCPIPHVNLRRDKWLPAGKEQRIAPTEFAATT
jgi:hypothetical protein